MVVTWMPDARNVVFLTKRDQWNGWIQELWQVPVAGGAPTPLPIDSMVGLATYDPDGHSIAYNRIMRDFRVRKRYNGGLAQQVYTCDFDTKALRQITTRSGTNASPTWAGRKIYYLSDQDAARRANIRVYDLDAKQARAVTRFTDHDIDFTAVGEGGIAFQQGGRLWMLDLPSEQLREVPVSTPDDDMRTRVHVGDVKDQIRDADIAGQTDFALAPDGKRTLFSARGNVFSVPTEGGPSPDGRTLAFGGVLGEISNSHTYVGDGDDGDASQAVRPGLLGVDWALAAGSSRYRIATIYLGDNAREAYRSPLAQPGLGVKAGD